MSDVATNNKPHNCRTVDWSCHCCCVLLLATRHHNQFHFITLRAKVKVSSQIVASSSIQHTHTPIKILNFGSSFLRLCLIFTQRFGMKSLHCSFPSDEWHFLREQHQININSLRSIRNLESRFAHKKIENTQNRFKYRRSNQTAEEPDKKRRKKTFVF